MMLETLALFTGSRTCQLCQLPYDSKHKASRYCSLRCRDLKSLREHQEHVRSNPDYRAKVNRRQNESYRRYKAEGRPHATYKGPPPRKNDWRQRRPLCHECTEPIPPERNANSKICGRQECFNARKLRKYHEEVFQKRQEILLAGWQCLQCKRKFIPETLGNKLCGRDECREARKKTLTNARLDRTLGKARKCQKCNHPFRHLDHHVRLCQRKDCVAHRERNNQEKGNEEWLRL